MLYNYCNLNRVLVVSRGVVANRLDERKRKHWERSYVNSVKWHG
jgi:hypothetical protein